VEYLPGVPYGFSEVWVQTANDVNFILNPHLIPPYQRDSLVRSVVSPVWWHRAMIEKDHPMRQGVLKVIPNQQMGNYVRNDFVLGFRMN